MANYSPTVATPTQRPCLDGLTGPLAHPQPSIPVLNPTNAHSGLDLVMM